MNLIEIILICFIICVMIISLILAIWSKKDIEVNDPANINFETHQYNEIKLSILDTHDNDDKSIEELQADVENELRADGTIIKDE